MKRLLPVALLFAVLAVLVAAREVARMQLDEAAVGADEFTPLAAQKFEAKDVAKLEVTAPGGTAPAYVVERKGETWEMTAPFRAPAHFGNVEKLCEALATGDAELRADDAGTLHDFDLVPERAVEVRLVNGVGKDLAHVAVGRSTGARGAFVRLLGDAGDVRAFETTTDLRGLLGLGRTGVGAAEAEAPKAAQFRDRDFPTVKLDKPARIEFTAPGRRVAFAKKGDKWTVAEGGPGPGCAVNEAGLKQVLAHIGPEFKAKDLADPAYLGKYGLTDPKYVVAVTLEDGTVRRVFGSADTEHDTFYARLDAAQTPDVVYEASSWDWQRIFPAGSGLFTFENVDVPDETLTHVVVETAADPSGAKPASRIELTREGTKPADDWKLVAPDWPLVVRQASLRSLASVLRNVRPIDWIDGADAGAVTTVIRAGAKDAAEDAMTTIRVGGRAPSGKDRLVVLPKHPDRVFVLADSTVDRIAVAPASLFEPRVFHGWTDTDLKALRVAKCEGGATAPDFALEFEPDGWKLVRGDDRKPADAVSTNKWIAAVLGIEFSDPLAADAAAPADEWSVTVEKKDGTTRTLVLSAAQDGKRTVTAGSLRFRTDRADLTSFPEARKD